MPADLFQFEDFVLDRDAYELRRGGVVVTLQRIPFELLCLLAERHGQLVTREEILERVWGKGVFVDSENSINTAVRKVRRALSDNPEAPRFVATVPARGYRFVAQIRAPKTSRAELFRTRPPGVMVGRERELASLLSGLDDAASRRGRLFLISGETGVGKTRLADEVAAVAGAKRMALLVGHCSEHDEAVASPIAHRTWAACALLWVTRDRSWRACCPNSRTSCRNFHRRWICRRLRRGATCSIAFSTSPPESLRNNRR
jgi:DNA-binding winged helix-turn-helix (wHTH) protein